MRAVTDEQLIDWVARGDASCLGTLFERYNKAVYQYCWQITRHNSQAEDLTQEVFLRILRKAKTFRATGSFKAWMFNIARNITLDYLRVKQRRGNDASLDESMEPIIETRSAERAAAGRQGVDVLAQAMSSLPPAVREIIWLGRFEFDSYEELGHALGCKTGTARVRMHRAMQQLNAMYVSINGAPIDV